MCLGANDRSDPSGDGEILFVCNLFVCESTYGVTLPFNGAYPLSHELVCNQVAASSRNSRQHAGNVYYKNTDSATRSLTCFAVRVSNYDN